MNNLLYARLAKTNLSKNRQNILPYLLSCIGTVVMFFIMDTLAQGSGFDSMIGKDTILTVMGMGTYIIGLFAVIFLIYSNSFLAKRRKKEFGLFQILGMEKKHLAKILFFESLYLWAVSLGIGILLGVLLYRLLFLVLMKLTGLNGTIGFAFSAKAVGSTMLLFGLTFVINFLLSLRQIHVSQPVELLHGGAQGEREPKTKLLTVVLGFMLLGVGYYLALTSQSSMDALDKFFNAIALVMVGTYCRKYCIFENSEEKQELLLPDTPFYKHFGHAVPHEAKCGRSCEYLYSVNGCASGYLHQHMFVDGD